MWALVVAMLVPLLIWWLKEQRELEDHGADRLPTIPAFRNPPLASLSTSPLFLRPTTTRYIPANPSSLRQNPTNFAIPLRYFVRFA